MSTAIIIPARYASTRLPGKPLIEVGGKPIIQWVYEKAKQSKYANKVIVATDDERIYNAVKDFGGEAEMTSPNHQSGSDRIFEVMNKNPDITMAVNVQGDEPLITPESIDSAIESLKNDKSADIATLIREIKDEEEIKNPNVVKVVFDNFDNALYFSRSPIPYERNKNKTKTYAHIGLYAYKKNALEKMSNLNQSSLELAESLEQLRALQNGMKIKVSIVDYKPIGIDTPDDVEEFKKILGAL
ncbi:MAG: 3-deoxy-manno-octulosonate cytidylyltransferase [Candidatus Gastranaerophilales bacterium]|nr:3-deoxy-manno-octulosonate cytidylyltransferase [Candidatus Gastranaerophilales bacterium]